MFNPIKNQNQLLVCLTLLISCTSNKPVKILLIGDSTMAEKPTEKEPEHGWGQMLDLFFNEQVTIDNQAVNGRSTKSFIDEGRWQTALDSLQTGDYLLIQFGHNDQKEYDSTRYAAPNGAYTQNLERFIRESRMKGAVPVLLTPVMRRRFDENDQFFDTHGEYPTAVRKVANALQVPLIDLHKTSEKLIIEYGVEPSKKLFLWVEPGQYAAYPDGKQDNTHFSKLGALKIAALVVEGIKGLDLDLKKYVQDYPDSE